MEDSERPDGGHSKASKMSEGSPSLPEMSVSQTVEEGSLDDGTERTEILLKEQSSITESMPAPVAAMAEGAAARWDEMPDTVFDEEIEDEFEMNDVRDAMDKLENNADNVLGTAAQSFWSFASSVASVTEGVNLNRLKQNVSASIRPLGENLSSQLEKLAPADRVANIADSVKSVAESVQRNAQDMERAILAKANGNDEVPVSIENDLIIDDVAAGGIMGMRGAPTSTLSHTETKISEAITGKNGGDGNSDGKPLRVNEEIARVGEIVGSSIEKTVGGLWSGLWGEEDSVKWEMTGKGEGMEFDPNLNVPTTRFEKRVYELQGNVDTYCEPADDLDKFAEWGKDFNLDDYAKECIEILSRHEAIAELYERVVPGIVEEDTFWMRYFFAKFTLEQEEARRKRLLERAEQGVATEQNGDDGWGDDDWGDDDETNNNDNANNGNVKPDDSGVDEDGQSENDVTTTSDVKNASSPPTDEQDVESESEKSVKCESVKEELDNAGDNQTAKENKLNTAKTKKEESESVLTNNVVANDNDDDDDWGEDWE